MIIDIPYIKTLLNIDIENESIAYLINHYFDYICEDINVDSTLEEEEISITELEPPINPSIDDNLTLLQEAIIYAIACNAEKLGISVTPISQEIYNNHIPFFDTTNLVLDEETNTYILTYCDLFNSCLNRLKEYLNDTSNVGYLRRLLHLDNNDIGDNEIEFLIEHYTDYLSNIIPNVDTESPLFKQALYMQVACHIFRTNPDIITSPTSYKVDEVAEWFDISFDKFKNTWCDLADAALSDLKKQTYGYYGLRAYDRPGARTKYGGYGPSSRL